MTTKTSTTNAEDSDTNDSCGSDSDCSLGPRSQLTKPKKKKTLKKMKKQRSKTPMAKSPPKLPMPTPTMTMVAPFPTTRLDSPLFYPSIDTQLDSVRPSSPSFCQPVADDCDRKIPFFVGQRFETE